MYSPPASEVVVQLVGSTVESVSFGQYVLHISFDCGDRISIACPFRFDSSDAVQTSPVQEFPLQSSVVPRILGVSVVATAMKRDGTLSIDFSNGDRMIAYDAEPGYEAYTLLLSGREYVV